jgi:Flp pilus assembly protein TadG
MAPMMRHRPRNFAADQAGAALVEMTIITPLVLGLAAGVFEFSNIIHTKLLLEAGVRDGALYIARCAGSDTACDAAGKQIAVTGQSGSARVTGWEVDDVNVTRTPYAVTVDPDTGLQNYRSATVNVTTVEVDTSYAYAGTGLWAYLGFGALTLTVAHEERVLGN